MPFVLHGERNVLCRQSLLVLKLSKLFVGILMQRWYYRSSYSVAPHTRSETSHLRSNPSLKVICVIDLTKFHKVTAWTDYDHLWERSFKSTVGYTPVINRSHLCLARETELGQTPRGPCRMRQGAGFEIITRKPDCLRVSSSTTMITTFCFWWQDSRSFWQFWFP